MNEFREVIADIELSEILDKSPQFTWMNIRRGRNLFLEKLDRFFASDSWWNLYLDMEIWRQPYWSFITRIIGRLRSVLVPRSLILAYLNLLHFNLKPSS